MEQIAVNHYFGPAFGTFPSDIWILLAQKYLPHGVLCQLTCANSSLRDLCISARAQRYKKRICKTGPPSLIAQYKYDDNFCALQPQKGMAFLPDGRPLVWLRKIHQEDINNFNGKSHYFLVVLNFSKPDGIQWSHFAKALSYSGVEGLQVSRSRHMVYFLQILEDKKRICLESLDLQGHPIASFELDVLFLPSPVHYAIQTQFILDESQEHIRVIIIQPFLRKATLISFASETDIPQVAKFEFTPEIKTRLQLQNIVAAIDSKHLYLATNRMVVKVIIIS